jgi:enoyl-CoA hydratase/carnithine racemase
MSGERISGQQAYEWGLVEKVVPAKELEAASLELAERLASMSPFTLATIKRLLRETREAPDYEREFAAFVECLGSEDGQEGIAAFLEKRPPRWVGR